MKFKPIWRHRKYSIGYFKEGFHLIRMYFLLYCTPERELQKTGIEGILSTLKCMILGKALLYEYIRENNEETK
jgi:hypothetical protein